MRSFSELGLQRMRRVLSGHIESKQVSGLVALISRHEDVHTEVLGTMSYESAAPMKRDTIFRIASLSKVIAAVAAMILIEDCKMRLDDSVELWLPELANRRVLKSLSSGIDDTVPAKRVITVRDVLTYRTGFGSVMALPNTYPIQRLIRDSRVGGDGPMLPSQAVGPDEWIKKLGSLPWLAQPGEQWLYHVSGDVLGVLISRVSGKSFGTFLRERIFEPLDMKDTTFMCHRKKSTGCRRFIFSTARRRRSIFLTMSQKAPGACRRPLNQAVAAWYPLSMTTSSSAA